VGDVQSTSRLASNYQAEEQHLDDQRDEQESSRDGFEGAVEPGRRGGTMGL
jgi:hypothetical protein